jgi:hypothetical protein
MATKKGDIVIIHDHYLDIKWLLAKVLAVRSDKTGEMAKVQLGDGRRFLLYDDEYEVVYSRPSRSFQVVEGIGLGVLLSICLLFALAMVSCQARADVTITPFFEAGAAHRDCDLTDRMLCNNDNMGSDTPGYLGAGFEISDCSYFLWADTCTIQWIHQSYVDRGEPFNTNPEAQMDSYGMMFRWKIDSWSFSL